jgi:hypothetical protein
MTSRRIQPPLARAIPLSQQMQINLLMALLRLRL